MPVKEKVTAPAEVKLVTVPFMKRSMRFRGKWYGPGFDVEVPESLANSQRLLTKEAKAQAKTAKAAADAAAKQQAEADKAAADKAKSK